MGVGMNPEIFFREIFGYYAGAMPYSPQQKQAVWNWVQVQYNRDNDILGYVYTELLNTLSPKYKTLPMIPELNDALKIAKSKKIIKQTTDVKALYPPKEECAKPEAVAELFKKIEQLIKAKGVRNGKRNYKEV